MSNILNTLYMLMFFLSIIVTIVSIAMKEYDDIWFYLLIMVISIFGYGR